MSCHYWAFIGRWLYWAAHYWKLYSLTLFPGLPSINSQYSVIGSKCCSYNLTNKKIHKIWPSLTNFTSFTGSLSDQTFTAVWSLNGLTALYPSDLFKPYHAGLCVCTLQACSLVPHKKTSASCRAFSLEQPPCRHQTVWLQWQLQIQT